MTTGETVKHSGRLSYAEQAKAKIFFTCFPGEYCGARWRYDQLEGSVMDNKKLPHIEREFFQKRK